MLVQPSTIYDENNPGPQRLGLFFLWVTSMVICITNKSQSCTKCIASNKVIRYCAKTTRHKNCTIIKGHSKKHNFIVSPEIAWNHATVDNK